MKQGALISQSSAIDPDYIAIRPVEWFDGRPRDWSNALKYFERLAKKVPNANFSQLNRRVSELEAEHVRDYVEYPSLYLASHISATGDVYPCCEHTSNKSYLMGNVNGSSFIDIWNSECYQNLRKSLDARKCPFCRYNLKNIVLTKALRKEINIADYKDDTKNPHADFL